MNKNTDLILNALKYYDINTEKYLEFMNKAKYYSFEKVSEDNELEYNTIIFYDRHKKEFFRSKYEMLGYYNTNLKIWSWGWVINDKKNEIIFGKKLLNYALELGNEFGFLKTELITARSRVTSDLQVDIHVAIASYITKNPLIFKLLFPIVTTEQVNKVDIYKLQNELTKDSEIYYLYLLDELK
jgi:hypothetical protein